MLSNEILEKLPKHLLQYVKPQIYEQYTPIDQAIWRYVMQKNVHYLTSVAHESYLEGLKKTGISMDGIPSMYGMNRILKEIGWAAVCVDGLIPTEAFLEFQAFNVLVIASDIRKLSDIEYTPTPDIIHESAGHAPIIANPEYAEFLRRIGQIGSKAIASAHENELFEASKQLILLIEKGAYSDKELKTAEQKVKDLKATIDKPSEMSGIRNLHWWSVEYGLIGTTENPKIYGAGLLSSIGESKWCLSKQVAKIPYSIDAAFVDFDYTKPQPQLFVTPNFAHLSLVLEEYANSMAIRKGGLNGLQKLVEFKHTGTIELSTGLQISGLFEKYLVDKEGRVIYFNTKGPTALAYREKELIGHGVATHLEGFGSPIGKLKAINLAIEDMSPRDLEMYHIYEGKTIELVFEGNIIVKGEVITGKRNLQGKILLISFKNCTVRLGDQILFHPDWGIYDMAIGKEINAAFAGAADPNSFELPEYIPNETASKNRITLEQQELENLYKEVAKSNEGVTNFNSLFETIQSKFPNEWLILIELLQKTKGTQNENIHLKIFDHLENIKSNEPDFAHLIEEGLTW